MATPASSSKAPVPQIVRVKLERRDANGKLIETKTVEIPNGDHG